MRTTRIQGGQTPTVQHEPEVLQSKNEVSIETMEMKAPEKNNQLAQSRMQLIGENKLQADARASELNAQVGNHILPYIEQENLYKQYNTEGSGKTGGPSPVKKEAKETKLMESEGINFD
jgi:hypothetical protein